MNKDLLLLITAKLNLSDCYNLARTNKYYYTHIWDNRHFWLTKLMKEYGDVRDKIKGKSVKTLRWLWRKGSELPKYSRHEILDSATLVRVSYILNRDLELEKNYSLYYTPLQNACEKGDKKLIKALLKAGADERQTNIFRRDAVDFCHNIKDKSILNTLLSKRWENIKPYC